MDFRLQFADFRNCLQIGKPLQKILWLLVHVVVSLLYTGLRKVHVVESHLISKGWLKRYENLNISKVKYLALVIETEEAHRTFEVIELLMWLRKLGIKQVCLYDVDGVLKRSKELIMEKLGNASLFGVHNENDSKHDEKHMILEFASISDGKEAVSNAANALLKRLKAENVDGYQDVFFTEKDMFEALKSIGYGAPDPDLLLVYGPVRCHLGFPAWRLRYTEIVHMNPLKYKRYGSLIKAIYKFTIVRQNYGK
ncbi:hypothetical protein QQ045_008509 [Rhodiola kirilowii]